MGWAIQPNPLVLLILSEHSIHRGWFEHTVRTAGEREKELGRDVVRLLTLDDAWKTCRWPARLREQITQSPMLDFSKWNEAGEFERLCRTLMDGLDLFSRQE